MRRPPLLIVALLLSLAWHLAWLVWPDWRSVADEAALHGDAPRLAAVLTAAPPAPAAVATVSPRPRPALPPPPPGTPTARLPAEAAPEAGAAAASAPLADQSLPGEPHAPDISAVEAPEAASAVPASDTVAQTPVAQRLPRQGRVLFRGTAGIGIALNAHGLASWQHDGEHFESRLAAGLSGPDSLLDFRSSGRLVDAQIISETTRDQRMSKHSTSLIDQAGGKVIMQRGQDTREREIKGLAVAISALPPLLMTLDEKLERAALFVVGDFWVADAVLARRGLETLPLPLGKVVARSYVTRAKNGVVIEVWLAPDWHNAPLRIRIKQEGWEVDLKAAEIEIDGKVLARAPEEPARD